MMRVFRLQGNRCIAEELEPDAAELPPETVWIDLLHPSREEELNLERILGIDIPTREEMAEIEVSNRLYPMEGAHVLTANVVADADTPSPESAPVSFILTARCLITVRYARPKPFERFSAQAQRSPGLVCTPAAALAQLLDAVLDRAADILEAVGASLERQSRQVFTSDQARRSDVMKEQLKELGRQGDIVSKVRESLVSLSRLIAYARRIEQLRGEPQAMTQLDTLEGDIGALSDHVDFLSEKITFLLDAMLGMINIQQNALIKFFSVVAVTFLPPTLIASVYGMNFEHMPELAWPPAYPVVLAAMLISMLLPYLIFRRKGWL